MALGETVAVALKPWWNPNSVRALLLDLIQAELARLRPGLQDTARLRAPDPDLGALELDSLEFLDLATMVAVQFHLHETGHEAALTTRRRLSDWVGIVLESRAVEDGSIGFMTSGSTGQPKLCLHSMELLEQEAAYFATLLGDRRRILRAVPSHHIYGFLFAFMLPACLGVPVLDTRQTLPAAVLRRACPGDLILGHPAFFDLATRGPLEMAPDVAALSSTSPCPPELWNRLRACGCSRLIEIYGSSETAGIGWREAPGAPFRLLPHWSRDPDSPECIRRLDAAGEPLTLELPDRVQWLDPEHILVLGRRDGAIQVGGINVFPDHVRACLERHPEVAEALVRPDGCEPNLRLKAFVVPSTGCTDHDGLPQRLDAWLAEHLSPPERPRSITLGPSLPRSALGKLADWD